MLGADDLDEATQDRILHASHKVECVFQLLQQAVMDAIEAKVLCAAPPILSRAFHELSTGMLALHEAKTIAEAPFPHAYRLFSNVILGAVAICVPWMIALYTQGPLSCFVFTFFGVFLFLYLNSVADALDNPFTRLSHTIDAPSIQKELNSHLDQLLVMAHGPSPGTSLASGRRLNRQSMLGWQAKGRATASSPLSHLGSQTSSQQETSADSPSGEDVENSVSCMDLQASTLVGEGELEEGVQQPGSVVARPSFVNRVSAHKSKTGFAVPRTPAGSSARDSSQKPCSLQLGAQDEVDSSEANLGPCPMPAAGQVQQQASSCASEGEGPHEPASQLGPTEAPAAAAGGEVEENASVMI